MDMTEATFPILERCGPLNPLLGRMAQVIASKPDNPSPIVALIIPPEERPLLNEALDTVWQRFIEKRHGSESPPEAKIAEPHILDVAKLIDTLDWRSLQELLLSTRFQAYTVLVTDRDPGELLEQGKISKALRLAISMSFQWPDPANRTASMKRDYFLQAVQMLDRRVSDEIKHSDYARRLLSTLFADRARGTNLNEICRIADEYLSHFGNLDASKGAVEVLEHFAKYAIEARVSTPPMGEEIPNVDNATKVA